MLKKVWGGGGNYAQKCFCTKTRIIFGSNVLFFFGGGDKICVVFFYWFIET